LTPHCPWCRQIFDSWPEAKIHVKNCTAARRPRWLVRKRRSKQMTEPKTTIEPLSLHEVAFEQFEAFFESIIEQSQFTLEQQVALGEQLKASVEKRDKQIGD
jgi:hypothetical protein